MAVNTKAPMCPLCIAAAAQKAKEQQAKDPKAK